MVAMVVRSMLGVLLALSGTLFGLTVSSAPGLPEGVAMDFNTRLLPGVLHGWVVGLSQGDSAYVVEVTPLQKPRPNAGNYVQMAVVRPEYDGARWNDVLRVQLPDGSAALRVNIRVYIVDDLPLLTEFDTRLEPGIWHGFGLGLASEQRGFVADITPLEPGQEGDYIQKIHFQPEYPGEWIDVLRLQIPETQQALMVHVRVYETSSLPVLMDFDVTLEPGDWQGYLVQPAKNAAGYIVEVSPLDDFDAAAELALVQAEFDGKTWNDVLRVMTWADRPPLRVNLRVYTILP